MIRRPPRSTQSRSSAASDVYKRQVIDPDLQKDLVTLGMIEDVEITDSTVSFTLVLTTPACPLRAQLERDARRAVQVMTGVQDVRIVTKSRVQNPKQVEISNNQFKHVIAVG